MTRSIMGLFLSSEDDSTARRTLKGAWEVFLRGRLQRLLAPVAADQDRPARDHDPDGRPHRAEPLARDRADLLRRRERLVVGGKPGVAGLLAASATRSPRLDPK